MWREGGEYEQYKALGGGGWTRIDANTKKGADEYRGALFRGYNTSNVGRTVKWAGKKVWNAITLSRLNGATLIQHSTKLRGTKSSKDCGNSRKMDWSLEWKPWAQRSTG